jgi:hypothetical protein
LTLFRGQRRRHWQLLPKVARLEQKDEKRNFAEIEKEIIEAFKIRSVPYLDRDISDEWDWLSLAQHHGMPTRLLDWTDNALAGLWFATRKPPEDDDPGVVWIFRPIKIGHLHQQGGSPFTVKRTAVFRPRHLTTRIVAQGGWFTAHAVRQGTRDFVALERNHHYRNNLHRIEVAPCRFTEIQKELRKYGLTQSAMFPGLDSVCEDLRKDYFD